MKDRKFRKFKRFNMHADRDPIEGDIFIDLTKAEAIEFEEYSKKGVDSDGQNWECGPIKIIHISTNQSIYTVVDERNGFYNAKNGVHLSDSGYINVLIKPGGNNG